VREARSGSLGSGDLRDHFWSRTSHICLPNTLHHTLNTEIPSDPSFRKCQHHKGSYRIFCTGSLIPLVIPGRYNGKVERVSPLLIAVYGKDVLSFAGGKTEVQKN
jgi:hypothetical protein